MRWNEIEQKDKEEMLAFYQQTRSQRAIVSFAAEFDILPATLLRRLQEMDDEKFPDPQYSEVFPDRKQRELTFDKVLDQIQIVQKYDQENTIAQDEATWVPQPEYPELPIAILFMTDVHFGSTHTDYEMLQEHIEMVMNTPNMYVITGGDEIDNFNPTIIPEGLLTDAVTPDDQIEAWGELLARFNDKNKLGAVVWGNHTDFAKVAGINLYNRLYEKTECPFFTHGGGTLNTIVGGIRYRLGIRHTYWGNSKLNVTNSPKRMMQFGYPDLDVAMIGHTHWAAGEMFTYGGKEKIALTGGTYKLFDTFRKKWDGNPQPAGFTLLLHPEQKRMELCRFPEQARDILLGNIKRAS